MIKAESLLGFIAGLVIIAALGLYIIIIGLTMDSFWLISLLSIIVGTLIMISAYYGLMILRKVDWG